MELFAPVTLGPLRLRNRICMAPMSRYRSPGGFPTADNAAYYRRRAAGGVGMIFSEGTYVEHPAAGHYAGVPHFFGSDALAGWERTLAAVHAEGAAMMPQLWHVGAVRRPGSGIVPDAPGLGPHDIREDGRLVVRAMTPKDATEIAEAFARGAADARELGFDGVAIHGAHGYLLDQFLWTGTNRRGDAYGDGPRGRMRLACEVLEAMRAAVGPDFPIVFRFSHWKAQDYEARIAETPAELRQLLCGLRDAGASILDASARRFHAPAFPEGTETLAGLARRLTGLPVVAVGSVGLDQPHQSKYYRTADNVAAGVTDLARVAEGLVAGEFDLVGVGRALLADADWTDKAARGAFETISPFTRSAMDSYA